MSEYTPDVWAIIQIEMPDETINKVMGCWYGGFTIGDSWRINSGITRTVKQGEVYQIYGHSGSIYHCHEDSEHISLVMAQVITGMKIIAEREGGSVEVVPISNLEVTE